MTDAEADLFRLGRRSIVAARDVPAGGELRHEDLAIKRPGFGIPVDALDQVVGTACRASDVVADQVLEWDDLVR